jgi:hypothetical protein
MPTGHVRAEVAQGLVERSLASLGMTPCWVPLDAFYISPNASSRSTHEIMPERKRRTSRKYAHASSQRGSYA